MRDSGRRCQTRGASGAGARSGVALAHGRISGPAVGPPWQPPGAYTAPGPGGTDQNVGVIEPTDALRSPRSGWRAPTTRGPSRAGAWTTPVLWICGKAFRFPTSSTGGAAALHRMWTVTSVTSAGANSGHRVADRRRRRASRRPADR